jgi:hypothetical protein
LNQVSKFRQINRIRIEALSAVRDHVSAAAFEPLGTTAARGFRVHTSIRDYISALSTFTDSGRLSSDRK